MTSARSASVALTALLAASAAGRVEADAYRHQPVDVQHYDVRLDFGEAFAFEATVRADVRLLADLREIHLDFEGPTVVAVEAEGRPAPWRHESGRLSVDLGPGGRAGRVVPLAVWYRGMPHGVALLSRPNAHGDPVLFADNWPEGARRWLPTVDHPSDKATVDFAVTADARFETVAPGRLVEARTLPGGRRLTRWSAAVPLPTYCMVVGLADFEVTRLGEAGGVSLSAWVFPPDTGAVERVFGRSALMVEYYVALLGPFPYTKLAQVQSTTRYAGMENASAIFYGEDELRGPDPDEFPVAHEIAHQWWGNSVTPADWDDLWLSEGFATYFDALFYEHLEGPSALRKRMETGRARILEVQEEAPRAVVEPGVEDPRRKLTSIVYQKGAWVLHMLRGRVGEEAFFRGLGDFYRRHAGGNVTTADLQRVLEAETGGSLQAFFDQWLRRADVPDLGIAWTWDEDTGEVVVEVRQKQEGEPYRTPLDLAFRGPGNTETVTMDLARGREVARFRLGAAPVGVEVDPDGWLLHVAAVGEARTGAERARLKKTPAPAAAGGDDRR